MTGLAAIPASPGAIAGQADAAACDVTTEAPSAFPGTARITVTDKRRAATSVCLLRLVPETPAGGTEKRQRKSRTVTYRGVTVSASRDDGNVPRNVLDGDPETRWSASGEEEWIAFDFGKPRQIPSVSIAWYNGHKRRTRFKVSVSPDGRKWHDVFEGESSGKSTRPESYSFAEPKAARHVKITCYGNTANLWNSITEVGF